MKTRVMHFNFINCTAASRILYRVTTRFTAFNFTKDISRVSQTYYHLIVATTPRHRYRIF